MSDKECLTDKQIRVAYERWCSGERLCDIAASMYVCEQTLFRSFKRRNLRKPCRASVSDLVSKK
jgi:Ni/Co efflux regulator RcnB|nr:MAG TPA_asm: hypothetical protein [Caudoviricetes sp.]